MKFVRGDQVLYLPGAARGDPHHESAEAGFVTSDPGGLYVFCRFWKRGEADLSGPVRLEQLRTPAISEPTPRRCLSLHASTDQCRVNEVLQLILSERREPHELPQTAPVKLERRVL